MFLYGPDGSGITRKDERGKLDAVDNPEFGTWARSKGLNHQQAIGLLNERQMDLLISSFLGNLPRSSPSSKLDSITETS
jgi:hypothetical protein